MAKKITMNADETLELDYLVEQVSDDAIGVASEPNNVSTSIDYISTRTGVFNPPDTGTYQLNINGQTIKIEVIDIPDSVAYQFRVGDFASPWPSNIGGVDMSVNGMTSSTFANGESSVASDGADGYGRATGPEDLLVNETLGIAFTCQFTATTNFLNFFGSLDSGTGVDRFEIQTKNGGVRPLFASNGNTIAVISDSSFNDGSPHAVVINKTSNAPSGINIYIDDMSTQASTNTDVNQAFSHTDYDNGGSMGFFARDNDGTIDTEIPMNAGVFEFNSEPYTQTEREDFVSRRPEV